MNRFILWICLSLIAINGWAETVIEFKGDEPSIMIPIKPSTAREVHFSRIITFPGCETIDFKQDWSDQDLSVIKRGNTIEVKLQNPNFSTTINVFGDNRTVYPLMVYPSDKQEQLSGQISIVLASARAAADPLANLPEPIDSQVICITKHVYGWKPQQGVVESPDYDKEALAKGEKRIGRRVYESDAYSIRSIRIYRYKQVECYMCVASYTGDLTAVWVNFQEIVIPNGIAKVPRTYDVIDPKFPGINLKRGEPRILYFFKRAKD